MYKFDVEKVSDEIVKWVKDYFDEAGENVKVVIGISGGKDSSTVAAICVKALGKDRVVGVLMPQGEQFDIDYGQKLCEFLDIQHVTANIGNIATETMDTLSKALDELGFDEMSTVSKFNTPARLRMATLYGIAGTVGGRVVNTCNLSEDWVGYATKYGDGAGDFSPLMNLTVTEVKAIGKHLGLPDIFIEKTPIDGLCGVSDEENLGFTYAALDKYIRENICEDADLKAKIDHMRKINLHKLLPMRNYNPSISTREDM